MRSFLPLLLAQSVIASASTSSSHATSSNTRPVEERASSSSTYHTQSITVTSSVLSSSTSYTRPETGTCPSRTINYVIHTLAQQCLRADWSRNRDQTSPTYADVTGSSQVGSFEPVSGSTASVAQTSHQASNAEATSASKASPVNDAATRHTDLAAVLVDEVALPAQSESDADSPLDTAHFLSFEEWKKQNLAKVGQSSDNLSPRGPVEVGRKALIVNPLDSFGDENEIDLGFAGFGATPSAVGEPSYKAALPDSTDSNVVPQSSPALQASKPKDAGRTCKERTNYASFDCAATVLKSNPECKSASSVLVENKDSYMLNKCSANNKFFIVELCNDILVDTIVLANYEFFSSIFRQFKVSVSDRYPVKEEKWKQLGTFEASNTREVQAFLIENPLIWARYLRIEFLTHYGSEYYCPVSLLRVHGTTMMEEFRNQEELSRGEADSQEDDVADTISAVESQARQTQNLSPIVLKDGASQQSADTNLASHEQSTGSTQHGSPATKNVMESAPLYYSTNMPTSPATLVFNTTQDTCSGGPTSTTCTATSAQRSDPIDSSPASSPLAESQSSSSSAALSSTSLQHSSAVTITSERTISTVPVESSASQVIAANSTASVPSNTTLTHQTSSPSVSKLYENTMKDSSSSQSVSSSSKASSATVAVPPAQPSTQESFFKSISKRLQQLESNSTLGMQYIEEQSRILRDAFGKVEKRQINMTSSFLSTLNKTVMTELAGFRQAYDQLWQSTVIELEGQREQHQHEMTALSSRLTLVVDELVWQKRVGILQSTLLLLCLALVLFGRGMTGASDASLMQQVMLRSQSAFRSSAGSEVNSPVGSRSPVSLFRRKIPLWRVDDNKHEGSDFSAPSAVANAEDSPSLQVEFDVRDEALGKDVASEDELSELEDATGSEQYE